MTLCCHQPMGTGLKLNCAPVSLGLKLILCPTMVLHPLLGCGHSGGQAVQSPGLIASYGDHYESNWIQARAFTLHLKRDRDLNLPQGRMTLCTHFSGPETVKALFYWDSNGFQVSSHGTETGSRYEPSRGLTDLLGSPLVRLTVYYMHDIRSYT